MTYLSLKDKNLAPFDAAAVLDSPVHRELIDLTASVDGLIFASPVYNWGLCSELKKFVEYVGSTDATRKTPFFDKTVTFVAAAGLPHSYMSFGSVALAMMMDFKCVINPYTVYVHNRHWENEELLPEARERLNKAMLVMVELTELLKGRTYKSDWEI